MSNSHYGSKLKHLAKRMFRRLLPSGELRGLADLSGLPFNERDTKYFVDAEPEMERAWEALIWPMIKKADFSTVVDLAAGHGRNSAKLLPHANRLIIVDMNQECVSTCKERFRGNPKTTFLRNNGFDLRGINSATVTLLYTFDSMVHFDSDVIRQYLKEFQRVLSVGGHIFCHHSNYVGNPGGDFKESPHWRNFMSRELFAHYAKKAGLSVVEQKVIGWYGTLDLDCLSLLVKTAV